MMRPKTIAQMAILNWIDAHFGMCDMYIEFVENGDQMTLKYDSDTREVYAI